MTAAKRWREQLEQWAIPDHILAAVSDSPWTPPAGVFARRAHQAMAAPGGISYDVARAALSPDSVVLDIGAGAGAASRPLGHETITVDVVEGFAPTYLGRWPDIAALVPVADVVVCHHVVYNAPDLADFARALTDHARARVVVELTARHPMHVLNPLWRRLHGLDRPDGPTAEDAVAVLREVGIDPQVRRWPRPARPSYPSFEELVAVTRRRLCLPPSRDDELAGALRDLGVDPADPQDLGGADTLVTLWWAPN